MRKRLLETIILLIITITICLFSHTSYAASYLNKSNENENSAKALLENIEDSNQQIETNPKDTTSKLTVPAPKEKNENASEYTETVLRRLEKLQMFLIILFISIF